MNQLNSDFNQQTNFNNKTTNATNSIGSACTNLPNKIGVNQLNVNDLYAILKPVIKPYLFDQKRSQQNNSFNLLYLGSILIPYDTLSNASKLTSIRNLIEYFLIKNNSLPANNTDSNCSTGSLDSGLSFHELTEEIKVLKSTAVSYTNASIVNLKVSADRVRLSNKTLSLIKLNEAIKKCNTEIDTSVISRLVEDCEQNETKNSVYYSKSEIAFCGKIKENKKFFALVILSNTQEKEATSTDLENNSAENLNLALFDSNISKSSSISSSCLVFRYLNIVNSKKSSIDCLLNEISHIYRDQDCVFIKNQLNNNNNENKNYSVSPLVEPTIGNSNMTNNINYELVSDDTNKNNLAKFNQDFHLIKNDEFILINKKTNDIYFKNMNINNDKDNYALSVEREVVFNNINLAKDTIQNFIETPLKDPRETIHLKSDTFKHEYLLKSNTSTSGKKTKKKKFNVTPKSKLKSKLKTNKNSKSTKKTNYNFSSMKTNQIDAPTEKSLPDDNECPTEEENAKPIVSAVSSKPMVSSKQSFKSTENSQAQSIKLIKENLANLFLSKKSHSSSNELNVTNEGSNFTKQHTGKGVATLNDDSDILKTIEIETNKNIFLNKQNDTEGYVSLKSILKKIHLSP
jgi:hypothetical protein